MTPQLGTRPPLVEGWDPQVQFNQFNLLQIGQPRGSLQFSGQFTGDPNNPDVTGNAIADMLLGLPVEARISTVTRVENRQHVYGGFVRRCL